MLGKLMKYDMRYMARILPWLYLGGVCLSLLVTGGIMLFSNDLVMIFGLEIVLQVLSIGIEAIAVCSTVFMIVRIYRNMFSDEGYLTFTLPVKTGDIINSKILTGAVWTFFSYIVSAIMAAIPAAAAIFKLTVSFGDGGSSLLKALDWIVSLFIEVLKTSPIKVFTIIALFVIIAAALMFYGPSLYSFCAAVTHRAKKARAFASIGMFIGISYAIMFILSAVVIAVYVIGITSFDRIYGEIGGLMPTSFTLFGSLEGAAAELIGVFMDLAIAAMLIIAIVLCAVTVFSWLMSLRITKRKLNLN